MNGFIATLGNIFFTTKANRKYRELKQNPLEAQESVYFGKKFIRCAVGAWIMAVIAVILAVVCMVLQKREADLASGFLFFIYILCFAVSALLAVYSVLFLLVRLKYARWQRRLNDLPIGNTARTVALIAFITVIAFAVLTAVLLIFPLL